MNLWEAVLLGIIQGLTEFLPVSSSGHIELGKVILNTQFEEDLLFSVVVHFATTLSTIVIFWKTILQVIKGLFKFQLNEETKFVLLIALSMIPIFILGVFFKDAIEQLFAGNVLLVGSMLLCTGGVLLLAHTLEQTEKAGDISPVKAFIIGVAQAIAVLPGISRSGATIAAALILKVEREQAARFSFLMVIPPILGATLLELKDYLEIASPATQNATTPLAAGFVAAFVTGAFACQWMIKIVKKGKLSYFAVYCISVGIIAIVYHSLV